MKKSLTALTIGTAVFSVLIGGFVSLRPRTDRSVPSFVYSSASQTEKKSSVSPLKTIKGDLFDDWSAIGANYSGAYLPLSYLDLNISVRLNKDGTILMGNENEVYTGT